METRTCSSKILAHRPQDGPAHDPSAEIEQHHWNDRVCVVLVTREFTVGAELRLAMSAFNPRDRSRFAGGAEDKILTRMTWCGDMSHILRLDQTFGEFCEQRAGLVVVWTRVLIGMYVHVVKSKNCDFLESSCPVRVQYNTVHVSDLEGDRTARRSCDDEGLAATWQKTFRSRGTRCGCRENKPIGRCRHGMTFKTLTSDAGKVGRGRLDWRLFERA
nr:hypothetical protein CFP56_53276 [Quercus suber]